MRELVGKNFARLRKERGLTQEEVEALSGFSQWYISSLERGRRNPTIISLYELANAIGVSVADLIAESSISEGVAKEAVPNSSLKSALEKASKTRSGM